MMRLPRGVKKIDGCAHVEHEERRPGYHHERWWVRAECHTGWHDNPLCRDHCIHGDICQLVPVFSCKHPPAGMQRTLFEKGEAA